VTTPRTIAHDELMQLPVLRYEGPIHLVASADELLRALREIRAERVVGFDTETRPTFRKGPLHPPSLVQMATRRAVYLFQLKRLDNARALAPLRAGLAAVFGDAHIIKAGIALERDLLELQKLFPFRAANVVDLGDVAKRNGWQQTGVRNLAALFLGARITKGAQTSNWARPRLSVAQLRYAATDAWVCRELYVRFEAAGLLTAKTP
jgi:ribonuclease D